jgi:hypothetical protein
MSQDHILWPASIDHKQTPLRGQMLNRNAKEFALTISEVPGGSALTAPRGLGLAPRRISS